MNIADLQKVEHLAHAYIVAGDPALGSEDVRALLEARGIPTRGNPDFFERTVPELLIDMVRDSIIPFASLSPLVERKYVVLAFGRSTDAAQNALLKIVEESLGKTTFFLCIESPGHVLPTVRSRCIVVRANASHNHETFEEAKKFFTASYADRLAYVEKLVSSATRTQDRTEARSFLNTLLRYAHAHTFPPSALRDLSEALSYVRLQGSSLKAILSHLAVSLPR